MPGAFKAWLVGTHHEVSTKRLPCCASGPTASIAATPQLGSAIRSGAPSNAPPSLTTCSPSAPCQAAPTVFAVQPRHPQMSVTVR